MLQVNRGQSELNKICKYFNVEKVRHGRSCTGLGTISSKFFCGDDQYQRVFAEEL